MIFLHDSKNFPENEGGFQLNLKQTPIFPLYSSHGAKTVEFGGWDMPVQFTGIIAEHEAVRSNVGLFDVSHMGEFVVEGPDARAFIQYMVTNDVEKLTPGAAMYTPMTYDSGYCVDDLLVYCFSNTRFWLVVNAGNIDKDFAWLSEHLSGFNVTLTDRSKDIALLALQGPRAVDLLQPMVSVDLSQLATYRFVECSLSGQDVVVSRTGYTGEDGFELYVQSDGAVDVWNDILKQGSNYNLQLCGLGCRDTLRMEARLPLYGHELTDKITPLEAGIGMFVKLDKGDFIGRDALRAQKDAGLTRRIVGVRLLSRGIPRADYKLFVGDKEVGYFTSGTLSPTTKEAIGLALVDIAYATIGTKLMADIRGKRIDAEVVKTPFYKRNS